MTTVEAASITAGDVPCNKVHSLRTFELPCTTVTENVVHRRHKSIRLHPMPVLHEVVLNK
jgi:hypothetical protein